jgi:hypothetical protein
MTATVPFRTIAVVASLALAWPVAASKPRVWQTHAASHYEQATLTNAVVSNAGAIRLGRQMQPLALSGSKFSAEHVWEVVEHVDGHLWVATGNAGKLYRIAPTGAAKLVYEDKSAQFLSLACGPDHSVYVGTGPTGALVRVLPDGTTTTLTKNLGSYIWALTVSGDALYAGTGPDGRIYQVTPTGAEVFYTTQQDHVLCLATDAKGTLYAGTDKAGLVYRITPAGKGFVLFQAPQPEVKRIVVTEQAIYACTSAPTGRRGGGSKTTAISSPFAKGPANDERVTVAEPGKLPAGEITQTSAKSESKDKKEASPASAPSTPGNGENSVYRIGFDGSARELFREKTLVLSLLPDAGRWLVGTGTEGKLFEVDELSREKTELARLEQGQITALRRLHDGRILLAASDPGKLYVVRERLADQGTLTSEVFDAKLASQWGTLHWNADVPTGTRLSVAIRSGNVSTPDATWSEWSAEQADLATASAASVPAARYLQYRVTLVSHDPTKSPTLHSLSVRFGQLNQAPELTSLEVPDLDTTVLKEPKKLKIKWSATDANEDDLAYDVYIRKDGWQDWVLLEEGLTKSEYEWDTTASPAGVYRVKLVASDRTDNATPLTASRTSAPVTVAHAPPTVTVQVVGMQDNQAIVEATATDPLVRLASAACALDGKKWENVFPTDGLFDGKQKKFRFTTPTLTPGTHVVVLRVKDAAGNVGTGDVVFTVKVK